MISEVGRMLTDEERQQCAIGLGWTPDRANFFDRHITWDQVMLLWADADKRGGEFLEVFCCSLVGIPHRAPEKPTGWFLYYTKPEILLFLRTLPKEPLRVARAYLAALEVMGETDD